VRRSNKTSRAEPIRSIAKRLLHEQRRPAVHAKASGNAENGLARDAQFGRRTGKAFGIEKGFHSSGQRVWFGHDAS
jgi:hypothetical protein